MNKKVIGTLTAAILFGGSIAFGWTGPSATPPAGNVAAPINVSNVDQVKNANLGVNGLAVFGNSLLQANSYLNWGAISGTSGFGIRDNAGTLEFKNNGGSWGSLQSIISSYLNGTSQWATSGTSIYYNTGNVGINTATPAQKLDVNGNITTNLIYDRQNTAYYLDANAWSNVSGLQVADLRASVMYDKDNTSYRVDPASNTYLYNLCINGACASQWKEILGSDFWQGCPSSWSNGQFGANGSECTCPGGSVMTGIHFWPYDHQLRCRWLR